MLVGIASAQAVTSFLCGLPWPHNSKCAAQLLVQAAA